jgi:multiple sugar transport system substrate-binding protein
MRIHRSLSVLGVALLALALTACIGSSSGTSSGSSSSSNKPVHLTMWQQWGGGHEEQALKSIISQYEKLHPNVHITEVPVTNSAKILTAIGAGTAPDIIDLGTSLYIAEWASRGALMPLNSFVQSSHLNTGVYSANSLKPVTYNGKFYGLPFMDFDVGLLYNKNLFRQAGLNPNAPPTTTEQLQADAYKLTKQSADGTITQLGFLPQYPGQSNGQVVALEDLGWAFGGSWYDPKTKKVTTDDPNNVAALSWEASFYTKFGSQNMANFVRSAGAYLSAKDPFESGKLAMVYDGPWALAYAKSNVPSMAANIGTAPFPSPASKPQLRGTTFIDTNPQVIPTGSKHAQDAFNFIQWETTNSKVTGTFANLVYNLPQLKKIPSSFKLTKDPRFSLFMREASSPNAHVWVQLPIATEYGIKLSETEEATIYGKDTPAHALGSLQQNMASAAGG